MGHICEEIGRDKIENSGTRKMVQQWRLKDEGEWVVVTAQEGDKNVVSSPVREAGTKTCAETTSAGKDEAMPIGGIKDAFGA